MKIIIVGDSSVGKSNLILQYTENRFNEGHNPTLGLDFLAKKVKVNDLMFMCQIWDTAGQENFRSITRTYYKDCTCAIIVFDITSRRSFNSVQSWFNDINDNCTKNTLVVLVGNKVDLDSKRQVLYEDAVNYANSVGLQYFETSAKNGHNVQKLFDGLVEVYADKIRNSRHNWKLLNIEPNEKKVFDLDDDNKFEDTKGKNCCITNMNSFNKFK